MVKKERDGASGGSCLGRAGMMELSEEPGGVSSSVAWFLFAASSGSCWEHDGQLLGFLYIYIVWSIRAFVHRFDDASHANLTELRW